MRHLRLALIAAALAALAGCAEVPDRSLATYRSNGQPRWLPCMGGDALCR